MIVASEKELEGFTGQVWQLDPQVQVGDATESLCDICDFDNLFATTKDEFVSLCNRFNPIELWNAYSDDILRWGHGEFAKHGYEEGEISIVLGGYIDQYEDGERVSDGGWEDIEAFFPNAIMV